MRAMTARLPLWLLRSAAALALIAFAPDAYG